MLYSILELSVKLVPFPAGHGGAGVALELDGDDALEVELLIDDVGVVDEVRDSGASLASDVWL